MRLYAGTSKNFIEDTVRNQIAEKLRRAFFDYFRYNPSDSEVHSWNNSLVRMKDVIQHSGSNKEGKYYEKRNIGKVLMKDQVPMSRVCVPYKEIFLKSYCFLSLASDSLSHLT